MWERYKTRGYCCTVTCCADVVKEEGMTRYSFMYLHFSEQFLTAFDRAIQYAPGINLWDDCW